MRPVRVRFAPSPTGSLHLGSALTAVANRHFADEHGGALALRIDDTDESRRVAGAEEAILADLDWLSVRVDEGPFRQSERGELYRDAARRLLASGDAVEDGGALRLAAHGRPVLVRSDGSAAYHLASVVDDIDLRITHVIRGKDLLPSTPLHEAIARALGAEPPAYLHHGLILAPEGGKLSKRSGASSLADLRGQGIPAGAVRAYLEELGIPRTDVQLDTGRLERLSVEAIASMPDDELAAAAGLPARFTAVMRGARTLEEARRFGALVADTPAPARLDETGLLTVERFAALREAMPPQLDAEGSHGLVRELKAVGGDLRALRRVLTGAESGPELAAVVAALDRDSALGRAAAAVAASGQGG